MPRLWPWLAVTLAASAAALVLWIVLRGEPAALSEPPLDAQPAAAAASTHEAPARSQEDIRQALFEAVQPIALANCELERFGESNDGGYLMCGNLLAEAQVAYSYGIGGYDGWGCDISERLNAPVHQYDCFDLRRPACVGGETVFHEECVAGEAAAEEGRRFDSVQSHFARNGDAGRRVVLKMDVEGAEWDSLLRTPDDVLTRIDQIAIEFHGTNEERFVTVVEKLKRFFYVAHLHFNNHSCVPDAAPFPAWAFEALLVSKRLGVPASGEAPPAPGQHPLDAPSNPNVPDCQVAAGR